MDVQVWFTGLALWLVSTSTTGVVDDYRVLLPNFAAQQHTARITVRPDQVVGGACPAPFAGCSLVLNGAGMPGGVHIEVAPIIVQEASLSGSLCLVPKLQGPQLSLRPEYTPPHGSGLAARLQVHHGVVEGEMTQCGNADDNCPRYSTWTISGSTTGATLTLSNLAPAGTSVTMVLKPGAVVSIENSPPSVWNASHVMDDAVRLYKLTDQDWCLYYKMFENASCDGFPPVPRCTAKASAPAKRKASRTARRRTPRGRATSAAVPMMIDTIACSNSQYP